MATYYVELDGGQLQADAALKGGTMSAAVSFSGAVIYPSQGGGGGGATLQTKSVSYTPAELNISSTVTPDPGYDGLDRVNVSVDAIPSTYVGSGITRRSSSDLTALGAKVTAPAGYYESAATKTIPDASFSVGAFQINSVGDAVMDVSVDSPGYVSSDFQLSEQNVVVPKSAQTYTPGTSNQTIPAYSYLTGAQTILGDANLLPENIKKDVSIFGINGTYEGDGMSNDIKDALLSLAENVAYINQDGMTLYNALRSAFYPVVSISAVYTQSGVVYNTDTLDSLKDDLVVTATLEDASTIVLTDYTLSGSLTAGTSTITVTYEDKTTTFNVTVTAILYPLKNGTYTTSNGEYVFTISNGNHVKCEVASDHTSTSAHFTMLNCYTGDYSVSTSDSINNKPTYFTIPSGKLVTLKLKNVVNSANGGSTNFQFIVLLRNANNTTSFLATAQDYHTTDVTVSATTSGATNIGAIGFGVNGYKYAQGAYVEFDVELTAGDDVYVGGN